MHDAERIEELRQRLAAANNLLQIASVAIEASAWALQDSPEDGVCRVARSRIEDFRERLGTYRKLNR